MKPDLSTNKLPGDPILSSVRLKVKSLLKTKTSPLFSALLIKI